MPGTTLWERFEYDPRRVENAPLRASDKDRDLVHELLGTAYSEGRLTREELDERADRVAAAKTLGELPPVVSDLVAPSPPGRILATSERRAEAESRYRRMLHQSMWGFLTPTLIVWIVWLSVLAGGGGTLFPWPLFVTIASGIRFAQLLTSRRDTIESIERSLERKERRRIEQRERRELKRKPFPPEPHELS